MKPKCPGHSIGPKLQVAQFAAFSFVPNLGSMGPFIIGVILASRLYSNRSDIGTCELFSISEPLNKLNCMLDLKLKC